MARFAQFLKGETSQPAAATPTPTLTPVQQALDPLVLRPQAPAQANAAPAADPFAYVNDPDALRRIIAQQQYAQALQPEQFTALQTDPAAFQAYLNAAVQQGVQQALTAGMKHTNQYTDHRLQAANAQLPELMAAQQTQQLFAADPLFSHPSMATFRDSLVSSFKQANPTATPQAAYEYAKSHAQGISQVLTSQQAASAPATAASAIAAQTAAASEF
jgi:hypothetical protein